MTTSQNETDSTVETADPKLQFQLRHVFYATTLVAIALSLAPWLLIPAAVWILLCYYSGRPEKRTLRMARLAVLVPFAFCFLGPAFLLPSLTTPHHHVKKVHCLNDIRQLQLAMLNYESGYMEFPEATELDIDGKPMHSWRIRILPYIEQQALYDQYDFSQPWDSPTNLKLLDKMPDCFRCPYCEETNQTPYKLVVGPGTLFDGGKRTIGRINDGTSNTLSIIEDTRNPVEWTRPSDLSIDEAIAVLVPEDFRNLPHIDDSTFKTTYAPGVAGCFDGSTRDVSYFGGSDPTLIRNLLQIDDGRIVDEGKFVSMESHEVPKHGPGVAVILFLVMMLYPLAWVFRLDRPAANQP